LASAGSPVYPMRGFMPPCAACSSVLECFSRGVGGIARVSAGLPLAPAVQALLAGGAGVGLGAVSTLLGVAGGELIIPTLVFAFGIPIKVAGTMSLLISVPTMLVGLTRHRVRGAFHDVRLIGRVVMPMALGSVIGSTVGGLLVAFAPAGAIKLLLGSVLIGSALRVSRRPGVASAPAQ
jgi:uncharacterized membrane protein YfcA